MQYISRFSVRPGKHQAFVEWARKNESVLKDGNAQGWTYLGTWCTVRSFGTYDVEVRWELTDYAALGSGFGSEALQKAWLAAEEYIDSARGGETYLMKSVNDIMVMAGA